MRRPRGGLVAIAVIAGVVIVAAILTALWTPAAPPGTAPAEQETGASEAPVRGFRGVLNGFRFYGPDDPPPGPPAACLPSGGRSATPIEIHASPLDFNPASIPPGSTLVFEGGNICSGEVVLVDRNWSLPDLGILVISHGREEPAVEWNAAQTVQPTTISGMTGVIVRKSQANAVEVYLKGSDGTVWFVSSAHTDPETAVRVAAGLR